ncbi:MAG: polysaccharide deacetylase family protein [Alphaproteobacteria bacterium]
MPPDSTPVTLFRDFTAHESAPHRLRGMARDAALFALSMGRSISGSDGWVRFPYYHHVFDDERAGFARQLDYLRRFGEFISLSDTVALLKSGAPIDGRYFCITFDDGFLNNFTNAVPIMVDKSAPGAFFLATVFIGLLVDGDRVMLVGFYDHGRSLMGFLGWDDCRAMVDAGMEIGSHTTCHARLSELDAPSASRELQASKQKIEAELGRACEHFCSPFGIPGRDFNPERDPGLVAAAGYKSMSTTERGPMRRGDNPFRMRRDHTLANWGTHQLRYFLSL